MKIRLYTDNEETLLLEYDGIPPIPGDTVTISAHPSIMQYRVISRNLKCRLSQLSQNWNPAEVVWVCDCELIDPLP